MTRKTLRVVINGLHAKSGGGVTYLSNVLPYLAADQSLELHLFLDRQQYDLFPVLPEAVRLHLQEMPTSLVKMLLWEQVALPILIREMKADVVFSPANYGPLLVSRSIVMLRNALSVVQWERRLSKRMYWLGLAVMTGLSVLFARRVIAVSQFARDSFMPFLPRFLCPEVEIIYHGIGKLYSADPEDRPRGDFLLAVSDIYVQKNLHGLIEALVILQKRRPSLRLLVAGQILDPDYYAMLVRKIEIAGLTGQITFLGSVTPDRLLELYRSCTAFVFSSTVETFGNPLVEAMACGAPIVCSNSAAMPEVLGDAGLYFDPTDCVDMADKIDRVLSDPDLARTLAEKGLKRAKSFSWSECAAKTIAVIKAAGA